jgi:hypothetical protein
MISRAYAYVVVICLAFVAPAWAQTQITTGVIQGTVTDATGAFLPGVSIEIKNVETNLTITRVSDSNGHFTALQLPAGPYVITFTRAGFKTVKQENVQLTVGQSVNLLPHLEVSGVAETITVTGVPTIDTNRSAAATTLDERTVATTPILGRKFEDLLTLTPGVSARRERLRRLHLDQGRPPDAVPQLQPFRPLLLRPGVRHRQYLRLRRITLGTGSGRGTDHH